MTLVIANFQPIAVKTKAVSVTAAASAAVQLTTPGAGGAVSISNTSATVTVAFALGATSAVVAVLPVAGTNDGDAVVLPGKTVTVDLPPSTPWISFKGDGAGPTIVYATPGLGC